MHKMDLLLPLIFFLLIAGGGSWQRTSLADAAAATTAAVAYWQAVLPGVPMPPAVSGLLVPQKGSNNLKSVKRLRKIGPNNGRGSSEADQEGLEKISASYGSKGEEDVKKGVIVNMSQLPKYLKNLSMRSQLEENSQEVSASYGSEGNDDVKEISLSNGYATSYGLEGNEDVKKITVSYGEDGKMTPNKITRLHSAYREEDIKEISVSNGYATSYGLESNEDVKKITVSYGEYGKKAPNEITRLHGAYSEEDIKEISVSNGYGTSYGLEGNEDVKKITVSYGEDGKKVSNEITSLHGAHSEEDIKEISVSNGYATLYGLDGNEDVKKITVSYGEDGKKAPNEITSLHGAHSEEDIKEITVSYGAESQEDVKKVTMSHGNEAQEDIKKITVAYEAEAQEDVKKVTMSYGDEAQEDIKKITVSYGAEAQENVKKVTMSYGDEAQEDIKKITVSYGAEAQEDVKKVTMSYGDEAQEDIKKITVSYGAEAQEDVKKVTMSYGDEEQEDIKKITVSYGAKAQEDVKKVTMSYGDEAQEDIKKITVSYGAEAQKDVKKITMSYGSEHDDNPKKESAEHGSHSEGEGGRYHADSHTKQMLADVFFFHDMLRPGSNITPTIPRTTSLPALLPRRVADAIPFSVDRLPDILAMFAPSSAATAREIRWALHTCEQRRPVFPPGERAGCATSLESLADLASSLMGTRDVRAFSSADGLLPVDAAGTPALRGRHTVTAVRRLHHIAAAGSSEEGDDVVTCHDLTYPYAVFYCHTSSPTVAYAVTMQASDADSVAAPTTMEALAVCHLDTSRWPAEHPFFVAHDGLRPGEVAVCHFLSKLSVVWVRVGGGDRRGDASA